MSQELTVYERMSDPITAVKVLGNSIAKSGMFNCPSVEAGEVFALECLARRMPPLMLAERYHVIFGKLSMKAEAMLAGFEAEGGKYKVLSRTPDLVKIEMTINGESHTLSLSWEEVQKEPFAYEGKEDATVKTLLAGNKPALKPKYATPRARMQMMWARLVSDSVRFLCPKVVSGVYTPEEIGDFNDQDQPGKGTDNSAPKRASLVETLASENAAKAAKPSAADTVIDVPFEPTTKAEPKTETKVEAAKEPLPATDEVGKTTHEQRQQIEKLVYDLQCGEAINKTLAKFKVGSVRELNRDDAQAIIDRLTIAWAKKQVTNSQAVDSMAGSPGPSPSGQATVDQVNQLRKALVERSQVDPAIIPAVKAGLVAAGRKDLFDLSANDAAVLYQSIRNGTADAFFKRSLETYVPRPTPATNQQQAA